MKKLILEQKNLVTNDINKLMSKFVLCNSDNEIKEKSKHFDKPVIITNEKGGKGLINLAKKYTNLFNE